MKIEDNINKSNSVKIILSNITSRLGNSVFDYANLFTGSISSAIS